MNKDEGKEGDESRYLYRVARSVDVKTAWMSNVHHDKLNGRVAPTLIFWLQRQLMVNHRQDAGMNMVRDENPATIEH